MLPRGAYPPKVNKFLLPRGSCPPKVLLNVLPPPSRGVPKRGPPPRFKVHPPLGGLVGVFEREEEVS